MANTSCIFYQDKQSQYWLTKCDVETDTEGIMPSEPTEILTLPAVIETDAGSIFYNIYDCAFYGNANIKELRLPITLYEIGRYAFNRSNIQIIYLQSEFPPTIYPETFSGLNVYKNTSGNNQLTIRCKKGFKPYYVQAFANIPEYSEDETKSLIKIEETNEVLATDTEYPALYLAGEELERITFTNKDLVYIGKMPTLGASAVITLPDKNPEGVVWVEHLPEGTEFPVENGKTGNNNYTMTTFGEKIDNPNTDIDDDLVYNQNIEASIISKHNDVYNQGLLALMPGSAMYYLHNKEKRCNSNGEQSETGDYIKIEENINENAFYNQREELEENKPSLYIKSKIIRPLAFQGIKANEVIFDFTDGCIKYITKNSLIKANINNLIFKKNNESTTAWIDNQDNDYNWRLDENQIVYCKDIIDGQEEISVCFATPKKQSSSNININLNGVTSIESYAFYKAHHINKITFTETINKVKRYAFEDCYGLYEIAFTPELCQKDIRNIFEKGCFINCFHLKVSFEPWVEAWVNNQTAIKENELEDLNLSEEALEKTLNDYKTDLKNQLEEYVATLFINDTEEYYKAQNCNFIAINSQSYQTILQDEEFRSVTQCGGISNGNISITTPKHIFITSSISNGGRQALNLLNGVVVTVEQTSDDDFLGRFVLSGNGTVIFKNLKGRSSNDSAITVLPGSDITLKFDGDCLCQGAYGYDGIRVIGWSHDTRNGRTSKVQIIGANKNTSKLTAIGGNERVDFSDSGGSGIGYCAHGTASSDAPSLDKEVAESIYISNFKELCAYGFGKKGFGIGGGDNSSIVIDNIETIYAKGGNCCYYSRISDDANSGLSRGSITDLKDFWKWNSSIIRSTYDWKEPWNTPDNEKILLNYYYIGGLIKSSDNDYDLGAIPEGGPAIGVGRLAGNSNSIYDGGNITIKNINKIVAFGGDKAAGIGSIYWTTCNIEIDWCKNIIAYGGACGPGIGTAMLSKGIDREATINISNSGIYAYGGGYSAGIGTSYNTALNQRKLKCKIQIGENVTGQAIGGITGAGIGTGYHHAEYLFCAIESAKIKAISGHYFDCSNAHAQPFAQTIPQAIGYGQCFAGPNYPMNLPESDCRGKDAENPGGGYTNNEMWDFIVGKDDYNISIIGQQYSPPQCNME